MQYTEVRLPLWIPNWLYRLARSRRHGTLAGGATGVVRNLTGDRDIEWSFVAAHIPDGTGNALDFGCGGSCSALVAARHGYRVTAIDLFPVAWPYRQPALAFQQGDLQNLGLAAAQFRVIVNCSTVEHVGLAGRYGIDVENPDGDLAAMETLRHLLAPDGIMILTIPVGRDAVFSPMTRVYGEQRLPRLLAGYREVLAEYWVKSPDNVWDLAPRATALAEVTTVATMDPARNYYALGCFVLRKA